MKNLGKILLISIITLVIIIIYSSSVLATSNTETTKENDDVVIPYYDVSTNIASNVFEKEFYKMVRATAAETSRYRLDENGVDIIVKDQGYTNQCWAFSLTSVLETTCSKTASTLAGKEFSPRHIEYSTVDQYTDKTLTEDTWIRTPGEGGNFREGLSYITSGKGPIYESEMPAVVDKEEELISSTEVEGFTPKARVKEAIFFPQVRKDRIGSTITYYNEDTGDLTKEQVLSNRTKIKEHIMTYGAVSSRMCSDIAPYYNESTKAYYNPGLIAGHAITIIGWDDNFSRDNFLATNKPISDGAWIVLQSYGTSDNTVNEGMGEIVDDGFFYISYDDALIEDYVHGIRAVAEIDYDYLYQYDVLGFTGTGTVASGSKRMAIYDKKSENTENIKEIGLYAVEEMDVTVSYIDTDENVVIVPKTRVQPGYRTLELSENRIIDEKEYGIVFQYDSPTGAGTVTIPVEMMSLSEAKVKISGDCYIYGNTVPDGSADYCMKVYTENLDKEEIPPESISISPTSGEVEVGKFLQLSSTILPTYANTKKGITWTSSNTGIATVSSSGLVTGKAIGKTTITAKTENGKTATCEVNVKAATINVESVSLNKTALDIRVDATETLVATILPDNATNKTVTWSSSNSAVATVSDSGLVKGIKIGTATITATSNNGKTATCAVNVKSKTVAVESISLNKTETEIAKGGTETLIATILPEDAANKTVTWSSSHRGVATVNTAGKVTAVAEGTAVITASSNNGKTATCTVTVTAATAINVESVSLNKTTLEMRVDATETLVATILPDNATNKTVTWSSNDTGVATVSSNGLVTAKKEGTAVITASSNNGKTATCTVTVKPKTIVVESITLNKTNTEIIKGNTETLIATILPTDADNKTVTWSSNNTGIATVSSSGVVKGITEGTAVITASSNNGKTATCTVEVIPDPTVPTSIITEKEELEVIEGLQSQIKWTVMPTTASQAVSFTSKNRAVATVAQNGVVEGITEGTAVINIKSSVNTNITKNITVKVTKKQISKVEMTQTPTKTEYIQNYEELDLSGGILKVTYNNGTTEEIEMTLNKVSVTGFDNTILGPKNIVIVYEGFTVNYNITIIPKEISNIVIGKVPTKKIYINEVEEVDLSGGTLVVSYTDESEQVVNMVDATYISHEVKVEDGKYIMYVTLQYENRQITLSYEIEYKEISNVEVQKRPNKVIYYINENLDLTGGELLVTYTDNTTQVVSMTSNDCTITSFDNTTVGDKTVEIMYYKPVTFTVHVTDQTAGIVSKIEMSTLPTKQEYIKNGEDLDLTGGKILVTYLDGTTEEKNLTDENVVIEGFDNSALGENTITVKYLGKQTTFTVKIVKDYEVKEIVITKPTKLEYIVNQDTKLDLSGGQVIVKYANGQPDKTIEMSSEDIVVTGFDGKTIGEQVITVTYNGKSATFTIVVKRIVSKLTITNLPTKLEYKLGETNLDLTGGQLLVEYNDKYKENISMTDSRIKASGFNGSEAGLQEITLTYENQTAMFQIAVSVGVQSISFKQEPTKKEYIQNVDKLDLTGGIILVTYTNGSTTEITLPSDRVEVSYFDNTKIGDQVITITFKEKTVSYTVKVIADPNEPVVEKIEINTLPNKIEYIQNKESLDLTGGKIKVIYIDGTSKVIDMNTEGVSVSGFNNTVLGKKTIALTYKEKVATFEITIIEENSQGKTLESIKIKSVPTKTNYLIGETLNLNGGSITATYSDKTTKDVEMTDSSVKVTGFDNQKTGSQVLTVNYQNKLTTFNVSVAKPEETKKVQSITIKKMPNKTTYTSGETLDLEGGVLTVTYDDGTTEDISMTDSNVTISGFNTFKTGTQTLTISYGGKSTTMAIKVETEQQNNNENNNNNNNNENGNNNDKEQDENDTNKDEVEDNKETEENNENKQQGNPVDTGDNIKTYVIFMIISLGVIVLSSIKMKK